VNALFIGKLNINYQNKRPAVCIRDQKIMYHLSPIEKSLSLYQSRLMMFSKKKKKKKYKY
jgi:hypothetical protein